MLFVLALLALVQLACCFTFNHKIQSDFSVGKNFKNFVQNFNISSRLFATNTLATKYITTDEDKVIDELLSKAPIPLRNRVFLINGWRWHTKSVIRDLKRLLNLTTSVSKQAIHRAVETEKIDKLTHASKFVLDFNWKSLIQVESQVFFPYVDSTLPENVKEYTRRIRTMHDGVNKLIQEIFLDIQSLGINRSKGDVRTKLFKSS